MLVRDAFVTIITRFGLAALIFATDVAIARLLGPAAKGRFALVLLYSQLAALLIGFGLDNALGYVAGRSKGTARRGFANAVYWALLVGGLAAVGSALLYGLPTDVRPRGPLTEVLPNLSAAQFTYAALAIPGEVFFGIGLFGLLGRKQVGAYNLIRVLRRAVLLILVVATAAIFRLSLDAALVLNLIALGVSGLAIILAARAEGGFGMVPSLPLLAEQLRFGLRSVLGSLAERLQFRADAFIVNILLSVSATGVYSVTSGLAETLWYLPNALGVVMFSRAVDPNADAGRIAAALARTTLAVTLALSIPVFIFAPWLVETIYGPAFAEAGFALRAIIPGIVVYSVVAILSRYVVGTGSPGLGTMVLLSGLGVNIVLNLILIPRFGITGAAAASSISYFVTAVLTLTIFRRLSGRSLRETLLIRRRDLLAAARATDALLARLMGRRHGPLRLIRGGEGAAKMVIEEHDPGEEL
ncbi:MAG: polysaccharide biosynthesis C-terminal domain-containing protein [Chloroflexi bacterium]|nr:polysaccharide biosynthesis C-terminal domain-containing protein [Chloroflexota bacterium]